MVKKINNFNNFNDKYNISINVINEILYMDIHNNVCNKNFYLIFNSIDLKYININNIDILYSYLLKCFNKENNYIIYFYEYSTELIIKISFINDDNYMEKNFKLYLTYYNNYYEKYNKHNLLTIYEINNNKHSKNNISAIYNYYDNITHLLKIFCISDDIL